MGPFYEQNAQFNSFIHRVCSLPFVPKARIKEALTLLNLRAEKQKNDRARTFAAELLTYIHKEWIEGSFSMQDWNLFDLDSLSTPTTNNGNEGTNNRYIFLMLIFLF